jgi:hypothetical protein
MSLEDLGNVGEFVAAIAVVVSLLYLAVQIRQNTRAVRSSVFSELQSEIRQNSFALASNEDLARIWRQANEDFESLTADERIRFFSHAMSQFSMYENVYFQHRNSMIEDEISEGWCSGMRFFLSRPAFKAYWANMSLVYSRSFQSFIEREQVRAEREIACQQGDVIDRP